MNNKIIEYISQLKHLISKGNSSDALQKIDDIVKILDNSVIIPKDKLHKILNIEEEIGIGLTVVFSALKNGVWYFDEQGQLLHDYVWLVNNYVDAGVPDKLSFSFKTFRSGKILLFAGYGKEWALTEERLHENCIINFYDICPYN